jgi:hypothetical protein
MRICGFAVRSSAIKTRQIQKPMLLAPPEEHGE